MTPITRAIEAAEAMCAAWDDDNTSINDVRLLVHALRDAVQGLREGVQPAADQWDGAEEWMPLAWELCAEENGEEACTELVWEGGAVPEPWGDRWLKYEDEAKRLIALVRKHVPAAPPAPAQAVGEPVAELLLGVLDIIARPDCPGLDRPTEFALAQARGIKLGVIRSRVRAALDATPTSATPASEHGAGEG